MKRIEIKKLKVSSQGKEILKGVDLSLGKGEVQALLGPNASGKSTLAQVIMGSSKYKVTGGEIIFNGKKITRLSPGKRAKMGLALAWQNPPAIKGVKLGSLIEKISEKKIEKSDSSSDLAERDVNVDFSGGEKKISEMLQIVSLKPKLVVFDEIDSGLDMKKTKTVAEEIKKELVEKGVSVLLITHSGEIMNFLEPAMTNVMVAGKIICSQKDFKKVLRTIKRCGYEKCKKC
jgi:Fe-S cluster assembly ATP-binding protein